MEERLSMHPHGVSGSYAASGGRGVVRIAGVNGGWAGTEYGVDRGGDLLCFVWARYTGGAWLFSRGCYRTTEEHLSIQLNYPDVSIGPDDY